jgi:hypothetical protein
MKSVYCTDIVVTIKNVVRGGTVKAVARVAERDDRTIRGEADVFAEDGTKVATFHSVFRVNGEW